MGHPEDSPMSSQRDDVTRMNAAAKVRRAARPRRVAADSPGAW